MSRTVPGSLTNRPGRAVIVSPEWLVERLDSAPVRIVDLRDAAAYSEGHIPGAVHCDLASLGEHRAGCDNAVLPPDEVERVLSAVGLSTEDTVVAYDDHWGLPAARFLWVLEYHGHRDAHVLDGGWDSWTEGGRPVSNEVLPPREGALVARLDETIFADRARAAAPGTAALVDTRTTAEYSAGHIGEAVSWDWFNAVPPEGWACSRAPEEIRAEMAALGVEPEREVIVYCRSGMRAAHTYMVLRHAGFERVRLYDGSWQDWSAHGD